MGVVRMRRERSEVLAQTEPWGVAVRKSQQTMIMKTKVEQQVPLLRVSSSSEETEVTSKRKAQQV